MRGGEHSGTVNLRLGRPEDAEACGRICYGAFGCIAGAHGFPSDFPSVEVARGLMTMRLARREPAVSLGPP